MTSKASPKAGKAPEIKLTLALSADPDTAVKLYGMLLTPKVRVNLEVLQESMDLGKEPAADAPREEPEEEPTGG